MDKVALPGVDVVHDVEHVPWPFADNEFDVVRASHVLEHLRDLLVVMEEIHRVLKPAGRLVVKVPYYRHETAFRDPTHYRFFTERSFEYFTPVALDGKTPFDYYTSAHFRVEFGGYGYLGWWAWHIDKYVPWPRAQRFLHRRLSRKAELRFTLVAVKDR
jgi:SAM-dependent methyltransferase